MRFGAGGVASAQAALVDVGGFFGIGERAVAIPVDQARTDEDGNLVTPYTHAQLEQMPE
jgi:hypothetical protein